MLRRNTRSCLHQVAPNAKEQLTQKSSTRAAGLSRPCHPAESGETWLAVRPIVLWFRHTSHDRVPTRSSRSVADTLRWSIASFRGDGAKNLSARFRNLPFTRQRRHWTAERTLERSIQSGQHFFLTLKPLPHAATRVKQLATLGPNVFADFVTRIPTEVTTCKGSNECDCWCFQMETFLVTPSGRQGYRRKRSCNVARIWERCHILHRKHVLNSRAL